MRSLVVLLIAALGLNLAASLAQASCAPQTLAEQAERADVVAFGNVSGSSFHVREALKGQVPATIQVRFGEGGPGVITSVDYTATNGDHTLYLRRDGATYATNACSGSHEGAPTAEERALFAASGGGTITATSTTEQVGVALDLDPLRAALAVAGIAALAIGAIAYLRRRGAATA